MLFYYISITVNQYCETWPDNEKQTAQRILHDLRQIKSTTNYANKFQLYVAKIDYDEKALMTCYR
jgi:hypothetical protein